MNCKKENPFKLQISMRAILWALLILIPLETIYLAKIDLTNTLYLYGKMIFDIIVIVKIFFEGVKGTLKPVWLFVTYEGILLISTVINNGSILAQGEKALTTCCFILFFDYMMHRNCQNGLKALMLVYEILIYANFILLLLYPDGIYIQGGRGVWLFGQANDATIYITCGMMFALLYSYYVTPKQGMSMRSFCLLITCVLSTILTGSATSIVGMLIIFLFILVYRIWGVVISPIIGLVGSFAIFVGFIVLQLQTRFEYLIVNVLHRTLTFSNRIRLWSNALIVINHKPILGYGVERTKDIQIKFYGYNTPHNKILYTSYQGGIVLLIVFLLMIFYCIYCLRKNKKNYASMVVSAVICALLIQMQFESYTLLPFWIPFLSGMYIDRIVALRGEQNDRGSAKIFFRKKNNVFRSTSR